MPHEDWLRGVTSGIATPPLASRKSWEIYLSTDLTVSYIFKITFARIWRSSCQTCLRWNKCLVTQSGVYFRFSVTMQCANYLEMHIFISTHIHTHKYTYLIRIHSSKYSKYTCIHITTNMNIYWYTHCLFQIRSFFYQQWLCFRHTQLIIHQSNYLYR